VRLYLSASGDANIYDAVGGDRWWSNPICVVLNSALDAGYLTMTCPLDASMWTDTWGRRGTEIWGFANSLNKPTWLGMTLGAEFFGHGVWCVKGKAEMQVTDLSY